MAADCLKNVLFRFRQSILILAVFALAFFSGCSEGEAPQQVDLSNRVSNDLLHQVADKQTFSFGIGSMITPKEGFDYYKQMIHYVSDKMGEEIKIVDRGTYDEFNNLLEHQQLDAAFVCGGPYVEGREKFNLELLALPEVAHGPVYFSYLIVPADSPAQSLEDLRGRVFAFTDPKSNSGMIAPSFWLANMKETPETFFAKHIFTYAHDASVQAVMDKVVDGAAVDSLIWDYMNSRNPEVGIKTRIIKKSQPFGIPPIVTRPDLPKETRRKLLDVILNMHNDPKGKEILDGMLIQRFIIGQDSDYDSIRAMRQFVAQRKAKK